MRNCYSVVIMNCPRKKSKESSVRLYSGLSSTVTTAGMLCNKGRSRALVPGRMWELRTDTGRGRGFACERSHLRTRVCCLDIPHGDLEYRSSRVETKTRR